VNLPPLFQDEAQFAPVPLNLWWFCQYTTGPTGAPSSFDPTPTWPSASLSSAPLALLAAGIAATPQPDPRADATASAPTGRHCSHHSATGPCAADTPSVAAQTCAVLHVHSAWCTNALVLLCLLCGLGRARCRSPTRPARCSPVLRAPSARRGPATAANWLDYSGSKPTGFPPLRGFHIVLSLSLWKSDSSRQVERSEGESRPQGIDWIRGS
jgi:hypothetical protein